MFFNSDDIKKVIKDWAVDSGRYLEYAATAQKDGLDKQEAISALLIDAIPVLLNKVPKLGRIVSIYDRKMEHQTLNSFLEQIQRVVHDYLMHDRGLYSMFYDEIQD